MLQLQTSPIGKEKVQVKPPSCNTGVLESEIRVKPDWIKLSFRQQNLPSDLRRFATTLFLRLARKGLLNDGDYCRSYSLDTEAQGFHGFEHGARLTFNGELRGSLQWGGKNQRGWVLLEICGGLCKQLGRREWLSLFRTACKYPVRIGRVDLALDDFAGNVFNVPQIRSDFQANPACFLPSHRVKSGGSVLPTHEWYESDSGRTIYIGSRASTTRGVVYEKGRQLKAEGKLDGIKNPAWVRWETRFTRNKLVELEPHLLHPDYWLNAALGSSDYLSKLLERKGSRFTMRVDRAIEEPREIAARGLLTLKLQYGGMIGHLIRLFGSEGFQGLVERNDQDSPLVDLSPRDVPYILEKLKALRDASGACDVAPAAPEPENYQGVF